MVDALALGLAPLGASSVAAMSVGAKWLGLANTLVLMYLTLLVLAVFVGELVGGLRRE